MPQTSELAPSPLASKARNEAAFSGLPALRDQGRKAASASRFSVRTMVRAVSYTACGVVAVMLLTSALPPLLSDSTRRAVVNVPLTFVTSPIAGEVTAIDARADERVYAGQVVARVENERVDRSTLIGLQSALVGARIAMQSLRHQLKMVSDQLADVSADVDSQRKYLLKQARALEAEAQAHAASEAIGMQERKSVEQRKRALLGQGFVSQAQMDTAARETFAAQQDLEASLAVLQRRHAQREAIQGGQFVGESLGPAAELALKQRDLLQEQKRLSLAIEENGAKLDAIEHATAAEEARVEKLTAKQVAAPIGGAVFKVIASPGQYVAAGDVLVSTVQCDRTKIAAIFSIRQAASLAVGSRVRITGEGWTGAGEGRVVQVMPRTNDGADSTYAVPFPPIERREMYVLIEPSQAGFSRAGGTGGAPCGIGEWVSVTSVEGDGFAGRAASAVSGLFGDMFGVTRPASAASRSAGRT